MRVADIARADVHRWFDSMSGTPGNANRALPVLSVMMRHAELWDLRPQGSNPCRNIRRYRMKPRERFLSVDELKRLGFVLDHAEDTQAAAAIRLLLFTGARQWGELGPHVPDACANIARNPRRPGARFLARDELQRLGAVLDRHQGEHPWPVAALRLLTLTGARLCEVLNLKWDEIGELTEDGARARLEDSKTGPRTVWFGPEAARLLAALPRNRDSDRVFPESLTTHRLHTFWVGLREEAELPGLSIHDARHTWASQGIMNGVGLTTVGRLLGHRKRRTTAIYAHLDDNALQGAAVQAAGLIAKAMGYKAEPPPFPEEENDHQAGRTVAASRARQTQARPAPSPTASARFRSERDWEYDQTPRHAPLRPSEPAQAGWDQSQSQPVDHLEDQGRHALPRPRIPFVQI